MRVLHACVFAMFAVVVMAGASAKNDNNWRRCETRAGVSFQAQIGACGRIIAAEETTDRTLIIRAAPGAKVQASAEGIVVGAEVAEDGNVIELRHAGEAVTRYGRLSVAYVQPGDLVQKGQVIGQVGVDKASAFLRFDMFRRRSGVDAQSALPHARSCK